MAALLYTPDKPAPEPSAAKEAKENSRATAVRCLGLGETVQLGIARHAVPDDRPWTWGVVERPSGWS